MKFFTSKQAAEMLNMTQSEIRRAIIERRLPAIKHGRDWLIKYEDVTNYKKSAAGRPKRKNEL